MLVKYKPLMFQDMLKFSKNITKPTSIFDCIGQNHKDLNTNKLGLEIAKNFSKYKK